MNFDQLNSVSKGLNQQYHSAYRRGVMAERARTLKELKRIYAFKEWEARLSIKDYINYLEKETE
jgi:hypothetical protein